MFLLGGNDMSTLAIAISQEAMTILTVLGVINTIISTIACPIIAGYKNRSIVGWLFGGFFLGLIGLIIVACLPEK